MPDPATHPRSRPRAGVWDFDVVGYRVDLRSFADSTASGVGDLDGIRERAGYLELLGVDAIWLTTLVRAPINRPRGREVDPMIGELDSFRSLVTELRSAGIHVAIDLPVEETDLDRPEARKELDESLRFWLDLGVAGVRVGRPQHMGETAGEAVHSIVQAVRPTLNDYPGRSVGAVVDDEWFTLPDADILDIGIDLRFADARFDADELRDVITRIRTSSSEIGMLPTWSLPNRRQVRPVTRYGGGPIGLARARALALVSFALPGVVGLDYGDELGLPDADMPGQVGQDPVRGPMPWEGTTPPFGFSAAPGTWWPIPADWASFTVEAQLEDPNSTLSLYRRAMELRRDHPAFHGRNIEWFGAPSGCFAFRRTENGVTCALNTSNVDVPVPPGEVLLSSQPLREGRIPENTAVWLVPE